MKFMEDHDPEQAAVAATQETATAAQESSAAAGPTSRWMAASGPWFDQALLNLRVWLPALRTPDLKARQVKYRARESRTAMTWKIGLPRQCWQCAATEGLTSRKFAEEIRSFESPTNILGGTWGVAALLLVFWMVFGGAWCLRLGLLIAAGGLVWLWIKSWRERLRVTVWSCAQHVEELPPPEAVSYDEDLYLFAPSEQLAEVARAELIASRKKEGKHAPPLPADKAAVARDRDAPDQPAAPLPSRPIITRAELPPLKLAGDDEETP